MIYFIIVAFFIALFQKRNPFSCFRNISFEWPLVILLSFGVQITLSFITLQTREKIEWVFILTFVGVVVGLIKNRKVAGVKWLIIGASFNLLALLLNGGTMPVSEKALELTGQAHVTLDTDARHHLMDETLFWFLGDWLPVFRYVLSPGDVLAGVGVMMLIVKHSDLWKRVGEPT